MGTIRRLIDSKKYVLGPYTMVGYGSACEMRLSGQHVSTLHATIEWSIEGIWKIRDLGSRNGTRVGGKPVWAGTSQDLHINEVITFGAEHENWLLEDSLRPEAEIRDPTLGERRLAHQGMLTFEGAKEGLVEILEEAPDRWVIERNGHVEDLRDEQLLTVDERTWRVRLPVPTRRTEPLPEDFVAPKGPMGGVSLHFAESHDLEHVTMTVHRAGNAWHSEKAYVWCLLELSRARLEDQARGDLPPEEHGWVYADDLCMMARYECVSRINVEVHRARKDMGRHDVPDGVAIVQRRRGTKQLRIGTDRLTVRRYE